MRSNSEADTGLRTGEKIQGSYQRVTVKSSTAVTLLPQRGSPVTISGADSSKDGELWMRRKDLAGVGPVRAESIGQGRIILPAGRWEVLLRPPSGYYCPPFSRFCASGPTLGTEFSHRAMAAFD